MKKLKKHAMILCLFLLLGVMALVISFNASAIGRIFLPASSGKVIVSSAPTSSSSGAKSQPFTQADLFPAQIGNSGTSAINSRSKANAPASSDSDTDVSQTETDTSGWNNNGNSVGDSDVTVAPISESAVGNSSKSSRGTAKFSSKSVANKPSPTKSKPAKQPVTPTKPQPVTPTTPQPVTPMQPTGGGSSNGGSSSRVVKITAVNLSKTDLTLKKGETAALSASVCPDNTTQSKTITWSSNNEKIATVDSTGKVTAVEGGSAKITAKTSNGVTGVCAVTVTVAATKITLNLTDIDLEKGDSRILTPTVNPTDSTDAVSWATSNNDIAAVDKTGKITAVAPGTATITATAGTVKASCKVTVGISITQLKLSDTNLTIKKGESHALTATINPPDTTEDKAVTWTTSDEKVATVNKDGNVMAIEGGTAVITAQVGTHTAQCTVNVTVPVAGISFAKKEINVERGSSQTLTAKIAPDNATYTKVDWVSTDETIADVDNNGKVTGISTGSTVITVKSRDGGFTAHCVVHVVVSITSINLSNSSLTLKKGNGHALVGTVLPADTTEDKTIQWTSSNPAVASVDISGNVTAVEGGTAVITARAGTHTAQCNITVIVSVTGISLDKTSLKLAKGIRTVLIATLLPADATDRGITWESNNPDVASVDDAGHITAVAPGTAKITAKSHDGGYTASCTVTVVIPVTGISLNKSSLTIIKGQTSRLTAAIIPTDATDRTISWTTSNPGVVTIDSSGNLMAVGGGTATITATTHDRGYTAQCQVAVIVPVTSIMLDKTSLSLATGNSATLKATLQPSDVTDAGISWVSSNPSIISVDQSGNVRAIAGAGSAVITATSHYGGFSASCNVIIQNTPSAPQNLNASVANKFNDNPITLNVIWNIPESDGNSPITGYKITINGKDYSATGNSYSINLPGSYHEEGGNGYTSVNSTKYYQSSINLTNNAKLTITVSGINANGIGKSITKVYQCTAGAIEWIDHGSSTGPETDANGYVHYITHKLEIECTKTNYTITEI